MASPSSFSTSTRCTTSSTSAVGAVLLAAALTSASTAKGVNSLVGGVYLLVGIAGLFLTTSDANILALNGPDNALHLASAMVLLGVGLSQDKRIASRSTHARRSYA